MKTQYEIRDAGLRGIFIGFDTEWEAMRYWQENVESVPETNLMHGAVVVRHSWETKSEAETARLDWLIAKLMEGPRTLAAAIADRDDMERPILDRAAIDAARKAPPRTAVVIWPNAEVSHGDGSANPTPVKS